MIRIFLLLKYNNTKDRSCLYRRWGLSFSSAGVQSSAELKQFFELPLFVKGRAFAFEIDKKNNSELFSF